MKSMELRAILLVAGLCLGACGESPPGRTYFERNIQPILEQKCTGNTSGCHSVNAGDPFQLAAGNLDVTSFERLQKRRDTLEKFGAYPFPLFLIKAVGPDQLKLQYGGEFHDIEVQHVGGSIIEIGSDAYFTLLTWLENGATENGLKPPTPPQVGEGACSTTIPPDFDRTRFITADTQAHFQAFTSDVQPVLERKGCMAGSCHGAPYSDFYITCGTTDEQREFNFSQAWAFVADAVDDSQLLRIPLAVAEGGHGHTGGDHFRLDDEDYQRIRAWAESIGALDFAGNSAAKQFFAQRVQPVLLTRGCSFEACHSPQAANDFKLRPGSIGFFSPVALEKNYELLRNDFMALEFPDARRGRAVAKTILETDERVTGVGGIAHRGGPVLETPNSGPSGGSDPADCGPYDPATASAFCTLQEWVRLERLELGDEVTAMDTGDPIEIVYVDRATGPTADRLQFDTFQGGADLRIVETQLGAGQVIQPVSAGASRSLLTTCPGLTEGVADVQAPDVSHDGERIAFAARNSASEPLAVWIVDRTGTTCVRVTPPAPEANGLKVHNFDPAWSPDGNYLVFASTRGKNGPTRSRKRFLPQSDLWRVRVSGFTADQGSYEQMTFLSNSEISPQFMREGRVIMTTEKASESFYQLSGRRLNWDLTDYHPLLGQRKDSPFADMNDLSQRGPSIGYSAVTDIREGSDGNFLIVLSNTDDTGAPTTPAAAGALAVFNRSIGPFEAGRETEAGYLASVRVLDRTEGYRTPSSLPDGTILVSYASNPASGNFGVYAFNPRTATRTQLVTGGGIHVDAQLVYKHPGRKHYDNRRQLVFGGRADADLAQSREAIVHIPDAPMLFTLLTSNLRRGRPVDAFRAAHALEIVAEGMCPAGPCSPNLGGIYEQRQVLGRVPLAEDGSLRMRVPAQTGVVLRLVDASGATVVTMEEEHQFGAGEVISMGVSEALFDAVCGGCHGSISGSELDVIVTPDALTGASRSLSSERDPATPN